MVSTYYVVKMKQMATADNVNFRDETRGYIYGKNDRQLLDVRNGKVMWNMITPYQLSMYGYKTAGGAKRNWHYRHPECSNSWTSICEVIRIIVDGKKVILTDSLD